MKEGVEAVRGGGGESKWVDKGSTADGDGDGESPTVVPSDGSNGVDEGVNVTQGLGSICALLRRDARTHAHLSGVVLEAGVQLFTRDQLREACYIATNTRDCRLNRFAREEQEL